jgi:prephenate dehydratase
MDDKEKKILRVAIQGGEGSFHDMAAREFFNSGLLELNCCDSFEELFDEVSQQKADIAVMAIENTVAGSLLPNYALLRDSGFLIIGEVYLRISQHLMALPGQSIQDIKEVSSHYMAIAQTRKFFKRYPHIKLVESEDTALSAKKVQDNQLKGHGAIAGRLAAEMYGLEILAEEIETNKKNFTRFLVLYKPNGRPKYTEEKPDKASLSFSLPHKTGSLSQVLSIFSFYDLNLTKIQSIPILGEEFRYHFLVDLTFEDHERYYQSLDAIRPLTVDLTKLGDYKNGQRVL